MIGVNIKEYRERVAALNLELETAAESEKVPIYETLYNSHVRMGFLLEAEKVAFDHVALLRKTTPKSKLVIEELRISQLLIDNGKLQQGLEHLDYATKFCSIEEADNKEKYLSYLMNIYYKLSMRDDKYKAPYKKYLKQYENDVKPNNVLDQMDYYMELAGSYFNDNDVKAGRVYKLKLVELLAKSTELSDAYKARYNAYIQQIGVSEMSADPDQKKLITYATDLLERNKKEHFLPSAGVFFWMRKLANAYKKENDINGLKNTFNDLVFSINAYVEENVDNKIFEQKYRSDYYLQEQKLNEAETLNKIKDSVFSNFNHELRTPLNIILSNCELIERDVKLPVSGTNRLNAIQNQSYNLLNIIDQFIEINKTNLGFNQVNNEAGDLVQFLQAMRSDLLPLSVQKNIKLTFKAGKLNTLMCELDFAKLERILYNLLNNAIKFTAANGHVTLQVSVDKKKKLIEICVTDTGIGIAKAELDTIFKQFYSVNSDQQNIKTSTGFGIGLYLVKQLVELIGGSIHVQSEPAKGSEFKLVLPLVEYAGKRAKTEVRKRLNYAQPRTSNDSGRTAGKGIETTVNDKKPQLLIVEDNADLLEIISASLETNFNIRTAADGQEAKELLETFLPDAVITDLMMPRMNGIELTDHIKHNAALSHLPVIMLTAKGSLPNRIKGWQAGIDMFLRKPFAIAELENCIKNIMQTRANAVERIEAILANASVKKVKPETAAEKFVGDLKHYVLENINTDKIDNISIARHLKIDESSMYRKVRALTGYSPIQLVTKLKILRAKELIEAAQFTTLKEVAYNSGFNDPKYFSQVYKAETGMLPKLIGK